MLPVGEEAAALGARLDDAYDALMATTRRHYAREGRGWFLSGIAGLDTPTMNRASVRDAAPHESTNLVLQADEFFAERGVPWSAVLSSARHGPDWHSGLLNFGFTYSSALDILARPPGHVLEGDHPPVRHVRKDELGLFTELLIEVFHMPRRFYPALHDMSAAWRDNGATLYFGLDDEDEPVATALLAPMEGIAGIYNVGTRRQHRKKGLARALMAQAFEDCQDADIVTLQVAPGSIAEHFYLRMGFEPVHAWRFYTPGARTPSLIAKWKESPG